MVTNLKAKKEDYTPWTPPALPNKLRPVQSSMTEFVQHTYARNIRFNNAPIEPLSMPSNQVQNCQVPNPFMSCTSARQTMTPMPLITNPRAPPINVITLVKDLEKGKLIAFDWTFAGP